MVTKLSPLKRAPRRQNRPWAVLVTLEPSVPVLLLPEDVGDSVAARLVECVRRDQTREPRRSRRRRQRQRYGRAGTQRVLHA
jgi:hypothetical protein